jgi:hypothetical protein
MKTVVEMKIIGVIPEEVFGKVVNVIKANVELILPNEVRLVEGLTVEVSRIEE